MDRRAGVVVDTYLGYWSDDILVSFLLVDFGGVIMDIGGSQLNSADREANGAYGEEFALRLPCARGAPPWPDLHGRAIEALFDAPCPHGWPVGGVASNSDAGDAGEAFIYGGARLTPATAPAHDTEGSPAAEAEAMRRLVVFAVALLLLLTAMPRGARAQDAPACNPVLDLREVQFGANGAPLFDANGDPLWQPALATGSDGAEHQLTSAYIVPGSITQQRSAGQLYLDFSLNDEGALLMEQISTRNIGRQLGIFFNGALIQTSTVIETLSREVEISGARDWPAGVADALIAAAACNTP